MREGAGKAILRVGGEEFERCECGLAGRDWGEAIAIALQGCYRRISVLLELLEKEGMMDSSGGKHHYMPDSNDEMGSGLYASSFIPANFERSDIRKLRFPAPVPQLASPSPLGLLGFALATIVGGAQKLGLEEIGGPSFLASVAMTLGGIVQIIAGIMCFYKNNTFSLVAFTGFGMHWFQTGLTSTLSLSGVYAPSGTFSGMAAVYYGTWTVFSLILLAATLRINKVMTGTLFFVVGVFAFDAGAQFQTWAEKTSGVFSVFATLGAVWLFAADILNELFQRNIVPLWPANDHEDDFDPGTGYVPKIHYHKEATSSAVQ